MSNKSSTHDDNKRERHSDYLPEVPVKSAKKLETHECCLFDQVPSTSMHLHNSNSGSSTNGNRLIDACINGNLKLVRRLVEVNSEVLNQRSIIQVRDIQLTNSTALHAAVLVSDVGVVRYLTSKRQMNVNATAKKDMEKDYTALSLAVEYLHGDAQIEIVRCLLACGAEWTVEHNAGKPWWELNVSMDLTILLLQYGVSLNSSHDSTSFIIAHKWVQSFDRRAAEIISIAIAKGIDIDKPNDSGLTPLMIAAIGKEGQPNVLVFHEILNQDVRPISRLNRINALELAGATLISSGHFQEGLQYWKKAMKLRFDVRDEPCIPKPAAKLPDIARRVYRDVREVQTKEEMKNLSVTDEVSLQTQAQLAYIRILGLKNVNTLFTMNQYACTCNSGESLLNYANLILQNCEPTSSYFVFIKDMAFNSLNIIVPSSFRTKIDLLAAIVALLQKTTVEKCSILDYVLQCTVDFTFTLLAKPLSEPENVEFKSILQRAVNMKKRDLKKNDLLLLACSSAVSRDDWYHRKHKWNLSILEKVISSLLELGANPYLTNAEDDTAVDVLLLSKEFLPSIRLFYEAGIELNQTNCMGESIPDILRNNGVPLGPHAIIKDVLLQPRTLKCLCACTVNRNGMLSSALLPQKLVRFTKRHKNGLCPPY